MQDSKPRNYFVEFVAGPRISETASHGPINSDRHGHSNIAPTLTGKD
jgi:hypothetical protein